MPRLRENEQAEYIDCDVHNSPTDRQLEPFLGRRWARYRELFGLRMPHEGDLIIRPRERAARTDAWPHGGLPPGSELSFMQAQLIDRWHLTHVVLNPSVQIHFGSQPAEYAAALTRAVNDWTLAEWVDQDVRLHASICVPVEAAELAAEEIHRLGPHPRFVQVLLNCRTRDPLGNRRYWPIYAAAAEHGLPVAIHVGGFGGNTITGSGWPSYYFEDHAGYAQALHAQFISLVCEGVFVRFPTLCFVLQEAGFSWFAPMLWRMDRAWSLLKEEVPFLSQPPSEIVADRIWITTQPIEEPEQTEHFREALEASGLTERLLFSSDYPHWDFDAPDMALPRCLSTGTRQRIYSGNARALYGFRTETRAGQRGTRDATAARAR